MCVAIYKPAGVKMPELQTLEDCFTCNPDGCGFTIRRSDNRFEIFKGFMSFEAFKKAYEKRELATLTETEVALHFRITTAGGTEPGNCHPFPLSAKVSTLKACHVITDVVLLHNGVLPITPEVKDISDTMELTRRISPLRKNIPAVVNLIEPLIGTNKICILHPGGVQLLGKWENLNGVFYSNLNWQYLASYYPAFNYTTGEYEPYLVKPLPDELQSLEAGYCPDCASLVRKQKEGWCCDNCDIIWEYPQKKNPGFSKFHGLWKK